MIYSQEKTSRQAEGKRGKKKIKRIGHKGWGNNGQIIKRRRILLEAIKKETKVPKPLSPIDSKGLGSKEREG